MDLQLVTAVRALGDQHRIVEITRRLAVDGDDRQVTKILPARNFFEVKMGHGARLGQNIFREDARQLVLADHHLHIDAKVIRIAEDFDHLAHRRPRRRRPTGDLHIDD